MTALRHHPTVKRLRRRAQILRATGRWRPSKTVLAASGNTIHVDPRDERGWEIVRGLGRGHQPALIGLWRRAVATVEPTHVIDVGANYGEMVLSGAYPSSCRVLAVEPNPGVAARLRAGIAEHPDGDRIELHECLASDGTTGSIATLRVDPRWSGSASVTLESPQAFEVDVAVRRIDDIVGSGDPDASVRLVLKIDAEGWEEQVLGGMADLLGRADPLVAIVEFDPDHLRRAGTDPLRLFAMLGSLGACWSVAHEGALTPVATSPDAPTDILVVSDPAVASALGVPTDGSP